MTLEKQEPIAFCRSCNSPMPRIIDEPMGQTYRCPDCKTTVELSDKRPTITIDRLDSVPKTTLNGGYHP